MYLCFYQAFLQHHRRGAKMNCEYQNRCGEDCDYEEPEDCRQYWEFKFEDLKAYVEEHKHLLPEHEPGLFEVCQYERRGRKRVKR